jgi:hypothetical protein
MRPESSMPKIEGRVKESTDGLRSRPSEAEREQRIREVENNMKKSEGSHGKLYERPNCTD